MGIDGDCEVRLFLGHTDSVRSVVFHPTAVQLLVPPLTRPFGCGTWPAANRPVVLKATRELSTASVFSRDGLRLASASDDGTVSLWDGNEAGSESALLTLGNLSCPVWPSLLVDGKLHAVVVARTRSNCGARRQEDGQPFFSGRAIRIGRRFCAGWVAGLRADLQIRLFALWKADSPGVRPGVPAALPTAMQQRGVLLTGASTLSDSITDRLWFAISLRMS